MYVFVLQHMLTINMCIDFLFSCIVLIHLTLLQYLELLFNGKYCMSFVKYNYHACQIVRYRY